MQRRALSACAVVVLSLGLAAALPGAAQAAPKSSTPFVAWTTPVAGG